MSDSAAFFRVEGTLSPRPTLAAAAWLAANAQVVSERLVRLGNVALAAPFLMAGPLHDATTGSRVAWMGLRGISEDRLVVLGEEYFGDFVKPKLRSVGVELVGEARRRGQRVVLVSDGLDVVMRHLSQHLEADELVCNRMEIRDAKCTGRLEDPVVGGNVLGSWARGWATRNGIDLGRCAGYGANGDDGLFLSSLGLPCAVHPDRQLRRMARDLDWPVVER